MFHIALKNFQLKFAGLEKNKLFVKDLNKETSRDHLEELFTKFGPLKEVRLITLRNGHSKGMAYVEYVDEVSAARALVQTDGEYYFFLSFLLPVSFWGPAKLTNWAKL